MKRGHYLCREMEAENRKFSHRPNIVRTDLEKDISREKNALALETFTLITNELMSDSVSKTPFCSYSRMFQCVLGHQYTRFCH